MSGIESSGGSLPSAPFASTPMIGRSLGQQASQPPEIQHVAAGAVDDEEGSAAAAGAHRHDEPAGSASTLTKSCGSLVVRRRCAPVDGSVARAGRASSTSAASWRRVGASNSVASGKPDLELAMDAGHQPDGDQRVAAEFEEVVVGPSARRRADRSTSRVSCVATSSSGVDRRCGDRRVRRPARTATSAEMSTLDTSRWGCPERNA